MLRHSKRLHLWLAAALHTSMMAFFQIFWAWTASWSSPHVDLTQTEGTKRIIKSRVNGNKTQKRSHKCPSHQSIGMGIELVKNQFPVFQFFGIVCHFLKRFPYRFQWARMTSPRTLRSVAQRAWRRHTPVQPAGNMAPKRHKRSKVWLHFTKKDDDRATCKVDITTKGGNTSNMQKHLHTQHAITMNVAFLIRSGLNLNPAAAATLVRPLLLILQVTNQHCLPIMLAPFVLL